MQKLQIAENCDGVQNPDQNCNALDYKIEIEATTGNLRIQLKAEDTLSDNISQEDQTINNKLSITGKLDVVNRLLAGTQFSPACDANDPGNITLLITALATGPQEKTTTYA